MKFLKNLFKKPITLRQDYNIYDARVMYTWGNSIESSGGIKVIYCYLTPRVGDLVIDLDGNRFVITNVKTPADPGDQHFVDWQALPKQS